MARKKKKIVYKVEVSWYKRYRKYNGAATPEQAKKERHDYNRCETYFIVLANDVPDAIEQVKQIKIVEYIDRVPPKPTEVIISNEELFFDDVRRITTIDAPKVFQYDEHHCLS